MEQAYERWRRVLADLPLPAALIDLDALEHNARVLRAALARGATARPADAPAPTLRIASKSVRSAALLHRILGLDAAFRGLLAYHAHEAALLAAQGHDDLLVAYPCARADEARALARLAARGTRVVAMVDCIEHVDLLDAAGREHGAAVPVCIDVDASWRPGGGALGHYGVRRSPLRDVQPTLDLASHIASTPGVLLVGLMLYEAQVAGIPDRTRGSRTLDPVRAFIKARSIPAVHDLRQELVAALREAGHVLELVNGGGTGSLASTARDPSVTEVTAGSGFFCPHLFDGYADLDLQPAAFFALPLARSSDPTHLTCAGGGYTASGAIGPDRQPMVHLPSGLRPLSLEGWGEVQTPFDRSRCAVDLRLGDPVLCRHAKAGELGERFAEYLLVRGEEVVERVATHRGLGSAFG